MNWENLMDGTPFHRIPNVHWPWARASTHTHAAHWWNRAMVFRKFVHRDSIWLTNKIAFNFFLLEKNTFFGAHTCSQTGSHLKGIAQFQNATTFLRIYHFVTDSLQHSWSIRFDRVKWQQRTRVSSKNKQEKEMDSPAAIVATATTWSWLQIRL